MRELHRYQLFILPRLTAKFFTVGYCDKITKEVQKKSHHLELPIEQSDTLLSKVHSTRQ